MLITYVTLPLFWKEGKIQLLFRLLLFSLCSGKFDLKPGTNKNNLFSEYGTNFRYVDEIKNGLDRVSVVASIPIPRFKDLLINLIHIRNCSLDFNDGDGSLHNGLGVVINKWCAKVVPYMEHLKKKEKYYMERLHDMLEEDLYAAFLELKPHMVTRSRHRSKTGFGVLLSAMPGFITVAHESIGTYLKRCQEKCISDAVYVMRQDDAMARNKLQQYSNDFLMYDRFNTETLDKVIDTLNSLHSHQTEFESVFETTQTWMVNDVLEAVCFSFDLQMYMFLTEEEHANQYHLLELVSKDLLRGLATLGKGRLPQELLPDTSEVHPL